MTKSNHPTLYVLADGTAADPDDCLPGKDGVLRHKNGLAVATRGDGNPLTIGAAATEGGNADAAKAAFDYHEGLKAPAAGDPAPAVAEATDDPVVEDAEEAKEATPAKPAGTYKTRDSQAKKG